LEQGTSLTAIFEAFKCCCLTKMSVNKTGFVLSSAAQRCALVAVLLLLLWGIPIAAQQVPPSELGNEARVPDSNTIVQAMEAAQRNNPANSRAYTVTRQYKLFHNNDKQPVSETRAEISFVPPDTKRYVIKQGKRQFARPDNRAQDFRFGNPPGQRQQRDHPP
jgi:hypothetical protein